MTRNDLSRTSDVAVVGAGVAGAMAALHLARSGMRVLLLEKSAWPRDKPCGGCLNAAALRMLSRAGVALHEGGTITRLRLTCRGHAASFPLPGGRAVSRQRLDALLVDHATGAGARFLPATRAVLGGVVRGGRELVLRTDTVDRTITARVVLDCGGLTTRLLPVPGWQIGAAARIGVGATLPAADSRVSEGAVHMACAAHGYVGMVRAERGITNIAAALEPTWCRKLGGPASAVAEILGDAGVPVPRDLDHLAWRGTPHLSRARGRLGAARVLVLGDAAGYVEPFTGEGMAWALADAAAVLPFAGEAALRWTDAIVARWTMRHARMLRVRHRVCRTVSGLLRHSDLVAAALPLAAAAPVLAAPLVAWLNRDIETGVAVAA